MTSITIITIMIIVLPLWTAVSVTVLVTVRGTVAVFVIVDTVPLPEAVVVVVIVVTGTEDPDEDPDAEMLAEFDWEPDIEPEPEIEPIGVEELELEDVVDIEPLLDPMDMDPDAVPEIEPEPCVIERGGKDILELLDSVESVIVGNSALELEELELEIGRFGTLDVEGSEVLRVEEEESEILRIGITISMVLEVGIDSIESVVVTSGIDDVCEKIVVADMSFEVVSEVADVEVETLEVDVGEVSRVIVEEDVPSMIMTMAGSVAEASMV